jgi:hypothetical protein
MRLLESSERHLTRFAVRSSRKFESYSFEHPAAFLSKDLNTVNDLAISLVLKSVASEASALHRLEAALHIRSSGPMKLKVRREPKNAKY